MIRPLTTAEIGVPIIESLGLDPKNIVGVTITIHAGRIPEMSVQYLMRDSEIFPERVRRAVAKYQLTPVEP